jgi:hypothetical protein
MDPVNDSLTLRSKRADSTYTGGYFLVSCTAWG